MPGAHNLEDPLQWARLLNLSEGRAQATRDTEVIMYSGESPIDTGVCIEETYHRLGVVLSLYKPLRGRVLFDCSVLRNVFIEGAVHHTGHLVTLVVSPG